MIPRLGQFSGMTPDGMGTTEAVSAESELQGWNRFIGRWETEGAHPMLPGEAIRGMSTQASFSSLGLASGSHAQEDAVFTSTRPWGRSWLRHVGP
jgi:hypothetical protein